MATDLEIFGTESRCEEGQSSPVPPASPSQPSLSHHSQWVRRGDTYFGSPETRTSLPSGTYVLLHNPEFGVGFVPTKLETDDLIILPEPHHEIILTEFQRFWGLGGQFQKYGFLHKRGLLLWGPPGSGKTCFLAMLARHLVESEQGIVLDVSGPELAISGLRLIRQIEPKRPIICLLEDLDARVRVYGESTLLSLLDGEAQVDRVSFVATTNYPEKLDKRFVDRPSRFDRLVFVGMPNDASRRLYLETKLPDVDADERERWVQLSKGFSLAHLREMIVATQIFGQSVEEVVERLDRVKKRQPTSDSVGHNPLGFSGGAK